MKGNTMNKEIPIYEGEISSKNNSWRKTDEVYPPSVMTVLGRFKRQNKQDNVKQMDRKCYRAKNGKFYSEHHEPLSPPIKWKFFIEKV